MERADSEECPVILRKRVDNGGIEAYSSMNFDDLGRDIDGFMDNVMIIKKSSSIDRCFSIHKRAR